MAEEGFVAVGIDISDDMTQIAFFTENMDEPQMTGDKDVENDFLIPTAIEYTKQGFVIGKNCKKPTDKLFWKARYGLKQVIGENDAVKLLAIFAEQAVRFALVQAGREQADVVTFSMPDTCREIVEAIRKHFVESGLGSVKLNFITHAESSIYYVLNQKKELRVNDVAFFDFSKDNFVYRKLHMTRPDRRAAVIEVSENDYTSRVSYMRRSDESFKELVTELFDRQQISTVYLIGEGFENEQWAKDSINYICNRRRVFKGRNLHALGACYKSMDGYDKYSYGAYCIVCKGRSTCEICMEVVFNGERNEAILIAAGEPWYDVGSSVEGILHNTDRINIVIRTVTGDIVKNEEILLNELPYRQDKMTRVKVDTVLQAGNEVKITVSDLGFGDFAVGSGVQIAKNIQY